MHLPLPFRPCDKDGCTSEAPLQKMFYGCGHSFHLKCILSAVSKCPICRGFVLSMVRAKSTVAKEAFFIQTGIEDDGESNNSPNDGDDDDDLQ